MEITNNHGGLCSSQDGDNKTWVGCIIHRMEITNNHGGLCSSQDGDNKTWVGCIIHRMEMTNTRVDYINHMVGILGDL